ncbi:uncharacterized protein [Aristolochia californica]|uniref:uncharacterized protein n=1 Tax=Aristolochia californica TaxID=171875 RepID=UPI0035DEB06A
MSPMDSHRFIRHRILIFIFALVVVVRAEVTNSVVFLDSLNNPHFRHRPEELTPGILWQREIISPSEVAAAVSILLGFAPPVSLSAESSYKLDKLLAPSPFDRPRAVFMVEVSGTEDLERISELLGSPQCKVDSLLIGNALVDSIQAEIQLPVADDISLALLDEPLDQECDATCVDKQLDNLAKLLAGSYVGSLGQLDGEWTSPLSSGLSLNLHVSKKADFEFLLGLVSLVRGVRKALDIHRGFAVSVYKPAELVTGSFKGIQALEEEYGPSGVAEQGMEVLLVTLSKLFSSLQATYHGQIVGVVLFNNKPCSGSEVMLKVNIPEQSPRWLEEVLPVDVSAIVAAKLVTLTTAWISGLILVISIIIGVVLLVNMPLTRDTLLYSNVKLD